MGCGASQPKPSKADLLEHAPLPSPRRALASAPAAIESNGGGVGSNHSSTNGGLLTVPEALSPSVTVLSESSVGHIVISAQADPPLDAPRRERPKLYWSDNVDTTGSSTPPPQAPVGRRTRTGERPLTAESPTSPVMPGGRNGDEGGRNGCLAPPPTAPGRPTGGCGSSARTLSEVGGRHRDNGGAALSSSSRPPQSPLRPLSSSNGPASSGGLKPVGHHASRERISLSRGGSSTETPRDEAHGAGVGAGSGAGGGAGAGGDSNHPVNILRLDTMCEGVDAFTLGVDDSHEALAFVDEDGDLFETAEPPAEGSLRAGRQPRDNVSRHGSLPPSRPTTGYCGLEGVPPLGSLGPSSRAPNDSSRAPSLPSS